MIDRGGDRKITSILVSMIAGDTKDVRGRTETAAEADRPVDAGLPSPQSIVAL